MSLWWLVVPYLLVMGALLSPFLGGATRYQYPAPPIRDELSARRLVRRERTAARTGA